MLGRAADHFMLNQMNERISAVPSNANGQSLQINDRERPGTSRFVMPGTISPGPDNAINSGWVPGATSVQTPNTITLQNAYRPGSERSLPVDPDAVATDGAPKPAGGRYFRSFLEGGLGADDPITSGDGSTPAPAPVIVAPAPAPFMTKKTMMVLGGLAIAAYFLTKKSRK